MPNYVFHDMTITGPQEERARFMQECFTDSDGGPQFDFNKMVPQPDFPEDEESGFPPTWYKWRCEHWGDKWNAVDTAVVQGEGGIQLKFETAWSPPVPILERVAERFPELKIVGEYEDGQMNFAGWFSMHGGNIEHKNTTEERFGEYYRQCEMEHRRFGDDFYGDILNYAAGEPNGIRAGTIGEIQAKIGSELIGKDPGLTSPDRREELVAEIREIYDRDHVVKITLKGQDHDDIPF